MLEKLRALYGTDTSKVADVTAKLVELYPSIGRAHQAAMLVHGALTGKEEYVDALPVLQRACILFLEHEMWLFPAKARANSCNILFPHCLQVYSKQIYVDNAAFYRDMDIVFDQLMTAHQQPAPQVLTRPMQAYGHSP